MEENSFDKIVKEMEKLNEVTCAVIGNFTQVTLFIKQLNTEQENRNFKYFVENPFNENRINKFDRYFNSQLIAENVYQTHDFEWIQDNINPNFVVGFDQEQDELEEYFENAEIHII